MIGNKVKLLCDKCDSIAVWQYMPGKDNMKYCDEHITRGCSCNVLEDGTMNTDEQGREYPCCEYDYNEKGFDIDD